MATYSGNSILDILINTRIPNLTHSLNPVNGVNLGNATIANFYGDVSIPTGTSQATINSTYFSDLTSELNMCIRIFHGNLTIGENILFAPPTRTKGMFILVKGNLINNGTISMTARGSVASIPSGNVVIWQGAAIPATGAAGAPSAGGTASVNTSYSGSAGSNGSTVGVRGAGGGGSGGARKYGSASNSVSSGIGWNGTAWSGGSGGGGEIGWNQTPTISPDATSSSGGLAVLRINTTGYSAGLTLTVGGGAGHTGGMGKTFFSNSTTVNTNGTDSPANSGQDGTGGLLMVAVLGNYKKGTQTNGFTARGSNGGTGNGATGGGSGGGSINVIARQFLDSNNNVIASSSIQTEATNEVVGGLAGTGAQPLAGAGGNGTANVKTITEEGLTLLPQRTLFKSNNKLWYLNFNTDVWQEAVGSGVNPFEQYGMFNAEVLSLNKTLISTLQGLDVDALTIQTYQP